MMTLVFEVRVTDTREGFVRALRNFRPTLTDKEVDELLCKDSVLELDDLAPDNDLLLQVGGANTEAVCELTDVLEIGG